MDPIENYISDALEIVSSWDLEDGTSFADAVNMQARFMAGVNPDDVWHSDDDGSFPTH